VPAGTPHTLFIRSVEISFADLACLPYTEIRIFTNERKKRLLCNGTRFLSLTPKNTKCRYTRCFSFKLIYFVRSTHFGGQSFGRRSAVAPRLARATPSVLRRSWAESCTTLITCSRVGSGSQTGTRSPGKSIPA
jgi:hypothetical protein